MYVSIGMYGLKSEVITLHTGRGRCPLCSGLLQNPTDCRHSWPPGRVPPEWGFHLEAQGLLLVPRPWSRITIPSLLKNPPFSMFTMAARSLTVLACLLCRSFSFPLLLLAQDVSRVRKMLMMMLSVWCVHGEKKNKTKHKDIKGYRSIKCLQVLCRGWVGGEGLVWWHILDFYTDSEISVQHCFLVPLLANVRARCLCIDVY